MKNMRPSWITTNPDRKKTFCHVSKYFIQHKMHMLHSSTKHYEKKKPFPFFLLVAPSWVVPFFLCLDKISSENWTSLITETAIHLQIFPTVFSLSFFFLYPWRIIWYITRIYFIQRLTTIFPSIANSKPTLLLLIINLNPILFTI